MNWINWTTHSAITWTEIKVSNWIEISTGIIIVFLLFSHCNFVDSLINFWPSSISLSFERRLSSASSVAVEFSRYEDLYKHIYKVNEVGFTQHSAKYPWVDDPWYRI